MTFQLLQSRIFGAVIIKFINIIKENKWCEISLQMNLKNYYDVEIGLYIFFLSQNY